MEADFQLQEHLRVGLPFCFMGLDGSRPLLPCSIGRRRKETSSKHKLARGLFKIADLKPSMQCKPNPKVFCTFVRFETMIGPSIRDYISLVQNFKKNFLTANRKKTFQRIFCFNSCCERKL